MSGVAISFFNWGAGVNISYTRYSYFNNSQSLGIFNPIYYRAAGYYLQTSATTPFSQCIYVDPNFICTSPQNFTSALSDPADNPANVTLTSNNKYYITVLYQLNTGTNIASNTNIASITSNTAIPKQVVLNTLQRPTNLSVFTHWTSLLQYNGVATTPSMFYDPPFTNYYPSNILGAPCYSAAPFTSGTIGGGYGFLFSVTGLQTQSSSTYLVSLDATSPYFTTNILRYNSIGWYSGTTLITTMPAPQRNIYIWISASDTFYFNYDAPFGTNNLYPLSYKNPTFSNRYTLILTFTSTQSGLGGTLTSSTSPLTADGISYCQQNCP
jgi:hypothetical protein